MSELDQQSGEGPASEKKGAKQVKKPLPACLTDFLTGDYPAAPYIVALIERKTRPLEEEERAEGVKLLKAQPELLPRVVELARASLNKAEVSRIRNAVADLASNVIRSQDETLGSWSRLAGSSAEAELGKLAQHLRKARASGDKDAHQRAEQLLLLGLAVVSGRGDFSPIGALAEIYAKLIAIRDGAKSANASKLVQRALNRASIKNLEAFSAINAIAIESLSSCQQQLATTNEQLLTSQGRARDQRDKIDQQAREIEALKAEKAALAEALANAKTQLSGVAGGRDADLNALRARYRKLLSDSLSEFVTQAHEALVSAPPAPEIAEVLLDDAKRAISKELEWLRLFLV